MRVLIDLVDNFTGMVRFIILAMMVVGLGATLILTAGASYVAPKVAEDVSERAAMLGEKAIAEARQAEREHSLAQEGWGYDSSNVGINSFDNSRASGRNSSRGGDDWGDDAQ